MNFASQMCMGWDKTQATHRGSLQVTEKLLQEQQTHGSAAFASTGRQTASEPVSAQVAVSR